MKKNKVKENDFIKQGTPPLITENKKPPNKFLRYIKNEKFRKYIIDTALNIIDIGRSGVELYLSLKERDVYVSVSNANKIIDATIDITQDTKEVVRNTKTGLDFDSAKRQVVQKLFNIEGTADKMTFNTMILQIVLKILHSDIKYYESVIQLEDAFDNEYIDDYSDGNIYKIEKLTNQKVFNGIHYFYAKFPSGNIICFETDYFVDFNGDFNKVIDTLSNRFYYSGKSYEQLYGDLSSLVRRDTNNVKNFILVIDRRIGYDDSHSIIPNNNCKTFIDYNGFGAEVKNIFQLHDNKNIGHTVLLIGKTGVGKSKIAENCSLSPVLTVDKELITGIDGIFFPMLLKIYNIKTLIIDDIDHVQPTVIERVLSSLEALKKNNLFYIIFTGNRERLLTAAFVRPGRVDQIIRIPKLNKEDVSILARYYFNEIYPFKYTESDIEKIADESEGLTAAFIAEVCKSCYVNDSINIGLNRISELKKTMFLEREDESHINDEDDMERYYEETEEYNDE